MTYPRGIMVQPGMPNVIFVTIGDSTPGRTGAIMRSKDTGKTWSNLPLPVEPNTAMWAVNSIRQTPNCYTPEAATVTSTAARTAEIRGKSYGVNSAKSLRCSGSPTNQTAFRQATRKSERLPGRPVPIPVGPPNPNAAACPTLITHLTTPIHTPDSHPAVILAAAGVQSQFPTPVLPTSTGTATPKPLVILAKSGTSTCILPVTLAAAGVQSHFYA